MSFNRPPVIPDDDSIIPLLQEDLDIQIQKHVTGVVRLVKSVRHHQQVVSEELVHETISVERVAVNLYIDEPVHVRQEGDVTIFPVMEEIVVSRRQLVLKEEIRVQRHRTHTSYQDSVPLRAEELEVVRLTPEQAESV